MWWCGGGFRPLVRIFSSYSMTQWGLQQTASPIRTMEGNATPIGKFMMLRVSRASCRHQQHAVGDPGLAEIQSRALAR